VPSFGATQRLPRLIGRPRAAEMILLGTTIDAPAAHAWGLVNAVTAPGETKAEAERIAASICARGPLAVRYAKEAIARGLDMPLDQALRYETDLTVILQTTQDRAEGVKAFLEKRPPRFEGR
jgi:enoyl-CoA hydratase/carnithine racemase